jgi:hypothetical protein
MRHKPHPSNSSWFYHPNNIGWAVLIAIHKLIVDIWNKEELPEEWKESITVPIHKKGDKKSLQFLPYGRSVGSWICLTHKTYTCHTVQNTIRYDIRCKM